ncbi:Histone-lysine N-methyltransferase, H3 lysine-9 specific SUVH4 [Vitis vinifera]|uniref:Histone-lysine N-methyltransferase, H3 lysine-9 specific SUVH4 n=1 Tax=Vitis vinifera TaxID=29760 RepID=A0A438JD61_VITVI|nr:Histone-lysine N-methyltransferase, H3 lysine-9 specific SUVH4 [Vitis vinifera]
MLQEYSGYTFPLAVAIVLSGQYEDDLDNSEDVVYTGQGGNNLLGNKRQVQDQVMERGNLALKNCMEQCVPVRVIRGHKSANSYVGKVYTYDGLYKAYVMNREGFWGELRAIRGLWSDPWCIGGDFNMVRIPREGFLSLKRGGLNNQSQSKLDWFLVSEGWGGLRIGPSLFRFENMWLKEEVRKELALNQVVFWEETSVLTLEEQNAKKQTKKEYKKDFHVQGIFVKTLNATFLVLIPKKGESEDCKDLRPISLGTQILDVMLIANEALDLLKSNDRGLLCKLDIEKVYDHVNWEYMLLALSCLFKRAKVGVSCQVGGWLVNLEKSELVLVGRVNNLEEWALEFGYKVGALPSSYFDFFSGSPFKSVAVWNGVEERTIKLLLEQIQRDFLWEGGALEWKPYLVRWDIPCSDKSKDGLGVKNLSTLHNAFLCKWSWRYAENKGALWKQVISCKYGVEGGWRAKEVVQYWAEKGVSGFTVFKYRLKRLEGQPILTTNQVQYARGRVPNSISEIRGLVCEDISGGQEDIPIPATNLVDDPPFAPTGKFNYLIW